MKGGGGGDTRETTSTTEPWSGQQGDLRNIFSRARGLSNQPLEYFPGQGYVDFSPQTNQALQSIEQRAQAGSPVQGAAGDTMLSTVRGDFLNSNPYLDDMMDAASQGVVRNYRDAVLPGIDSQAIAAGRYGSNAQQSMREGASDSLGRTLGNLSAQIYGGNYQQERGRQQQAAMYAPTFAQSDYADAERLAGVGQAYEGLEGAKLQDEMARHSFEQNEPWDRLQRYSSFIQGGNWGGNTTQTQPIYSNTGAGVLGGAATGAGLAQMLGASNPWSWGLTGAGALLGGF